MKFAFCTCVEIGLSCMEAIYRADEKLDLIISLPDNKANKKSGRVFVDDFAEKKGIQIIKSDHINNSLVIEALKKQEIDWLFIIGWSQIASKKVIETPTYGAIGAHPTLLPEGRGRAAIPWAIIKGLNKTGVTFFKMNEGVDSGLILGQKEVPITPNETATTLYKKIIAAHGTLIQEIYPKLKKGKIEGWKQNEAEASYWRGRKPEDGELKQSMRVEEVDKLVRATTRPYPGAFIKINDQIIIIWAGKIGVVEGKRFEFSDGIYTATNYEII